ncbi:TerB family tellurite resistance protein [Halopseudomonas salegens]|uniref:DnaJ like chaperone protein n=1 Tax=Halopseudomonas salegens TaxID=1434072 RepID=A0A1H2DXH8_9GAMM|nr:TerB family tellurite resistance protein [Halopseudomonas salegens]SDT87479.1 DnaJ like chaperone protein [Halopseudomonas salegens]
MLWPVTLAGGLLGAAAAGIPGALLGAVLGHALDRHWRLRRWTDVPVRLRALGGRKLSFERVLFLCLGHMAKANGRVQAVHLQLARDLMQQYRLDETRRLQAMRWFNEGRDQARSLERLVARFARREPALAVELMDACWRMALASGSLASAQQQLLNQWGKKVGVGRGEQQRMHQKHRPHSQQQAPVAREDQLQRDARLLGVALADSPDSIRRAYRRQLSRHHPDKLSARGASATVQNNAGEQIRDIKAAYARIRQYRGF